MLEEPPITYPDYGLTPEQQMPLAFWNFAKQHIPEPQRRTKRGKHHVPRVLHDASRTTSA
jgi:hypothetical protein